MEGEAQGFRRHPRLLQSDHHRRIARIRQYRDTREVRHDFLEELQPSPAQLGSQLGQACDVPTRPRQAGDEARAQGIAGAQHHDRDRSRCLLELSEGTAYSRDENVDLEAYQFCCHCRKPIEVTVAPETLDDQVLPLDVTELPQALVKPG